MSGPVISPETEKACCDFLKTCVEEWGPHYVIVSLPRVWENPQYSLGQVKLEFTTQDSISIRVSYGSAQLERTFPLLAVPQG
jgi:hypothetical protein